MALANILSIAGSDPSGGAGIQADLKTFAAFNTYGMAAITALTAQNTQTVSDVFVLPEDFVRKQIETVFADIDVSAIKVGMLANAGIVKAIHECLAELSEIPIVLDPVMVSTSGSQLLDQQAVDALKQFARNVTIITPNLAEAEVLLGNKIEPSLEGLQTASQTLQIQLNVSYVLLKGGHLDGQESIDVLCDHTGQTQYFATPRIETKNTHGTGCTLSSALAALLAQQVEMPQAVEQAKAYVTHAIRYSNTLQVGHGHGPLHHGFSVTESCR